jgi:sugar phosphate isomerase/epimerase
LVPPAARRRSLHGSAIVEPQHSRRAWLAGAALAAGATAAADDKPAKEPFGYCLNTSTIQGPKRKPVTELVDIAGKAGYQAIEPWVRDIEQYLKDGGNLKDLAKRIQQNGLTVESAIDFFEWVVDDDERRKKALEQAKRGMDLVRQLGGKRIAAPPTGATKQTDLNLHKAAQRYRALLELGDQMGVVPEVELWGFSTSLGRLGEVAMVAIESGHPKACMLLDVYHLHKGGSDFAGVKLLNGAAIPVIHFNDYPAQPPRAELTDAHRIYPGDGVAPLKTLLRDLHAVGFRGMLSLELFNKELWMQDGVTVARTGLEKMRAVVRGAF